MINQLWEFSTGINKEQAIGHTDFEIFPTEVAERFVYNDQQVLAGSGPVNIEEQAPHPDGTVHDYLSVKVPLKDDRDKVNIINHCGEHLPTLINQILDLSKIEAGRITLNETDFDLHHLLNDLENLFRLRTDKKGVQLVFERHPDVPRYVGTDG